MKIQKLIESFQIHTQLNPKLFTSDDSLRDDVSQALLRIAKEFINDLKEWDIPLEVVDIWLVGSNAAYNYTDESDIDVHIIANFDDVSNEKNLLNLLYNYVKSDFNKNYDIKVKGMEVEVYIEDMATTSITNGVYSILHNEWIKFPIKQDVEDINIEETKLYKIFYNQYKNLKDEDIEDFVNRLYIMRKSSLVNEGEFGIGNLVFKELRNQGILDELKQRKRDIRSKELTLENLNKQEDDLSEILGTDYLYHATYKPLFNKIKKQGYISNKSKHYWDISKDYIYLSKDLDDAASYAETNESVPEEWLDDIVILKIDLSKLNRDLLDIDENQAYSYDDDVNLEDPATWIDFQYEGNIPLSSIVEVLGY